MDLTDWNQLENILLRQRRCGVAPLHLLVTIPSWEQHEAALGCLPSLTNKGAAPAAQPIRRGRKP
jgi:hypothetical protein